MILLWQLHLKRRWPSQDNLSHNEAFWLLKSILLAIFPWLCLLIPPVCLLDILHCYWVQEGVQVGRIEVQHMQKEWRGVWMTAVKHSLSRELVTTHSQEHSALSYGMTYFNLVWHSRGRKYNRWTLQKLVGTLQVTSALKQLVMFVVWQHSYILLPAFLWFTFSGWRKPDMLYSFRIQLSKWGLGSDSLVHLCKSGNIRGIVLASL